MAGKASAKARKQRKKAIHRIFAVVVVVIMAGSILLASLLSSWY